MDSIHSSISASKGGKTHRQLLPLPVALGKRLQQPCYRDALSYMVSVGCKRILLDVLGLNKQWQLWQTCENTQ